MNKKTKKEIKAGLWLLSGIIVFFAILIVPGVIKSNREFDVLSNEGAIDDCIITRYYVSLYA